MYGSIYLMSLCTWKCVFKDALNIRSYVLHVLKLLVACLSITISLRGLNWAQASKAKTFTVYISLQRFLNQILTNLVLFLLLCYSLLMRKSCPWEPLESITLTINYWPPRRSGRQNGKITAKASEPNVWILQHSPSQQTSK